MVYCHVEMCITLYTTCYIRWHNSSGCSLCTVMWLFLFGYLLLCDVAIVDWITGNNNCPYIIDVARYTGSSPSDVISSVPINLDTLNRVIWISGEVTDKKPQLTSAASICYNTFMFKINHQ